ncbi:adenylyl-sulfate kinase [Clostridium sp. OS1-26]|uniref:adenylyl-sulfate kinase n=1 Tax=Clostridium sp. OS1-26 TaxID=3070681 RepID=UPI0027DEB9F1|nr:adenylyl-sulfate kinase [Clostridium sp. OS1-26]WML36765.1 adenylyl-sulfate kinase [Clostridium sp. OS1-26]
MTLNIFWHNNKVTFEDRCKTYKQKGIVLWFTGLSGAGKSTIAAELENKLVSLGKITYMIDGDNLRMGLNKDLGFSEESRYENIRRTAEVASLFKNAAVITLVSVISPYRKMREMAKEIIGDAAFVDIYVKADIETCINRDPKGLYKKAINGEIVSFTGISDRYEEPENPKVIIDTNELDLGNSVNVIMEYLANNKYI